MAQPAGKELRRYARILERIFLTKYKDGDRVVEFTRNDFDGTCKDLGIPVPSNLGDILYDARYRYGLAQSIRNTAPEGYEWVLPSSGRSTYRFELRGAAPIAPNPLLTETKVADATPGIITMYTLGDEQALLAKVRYNRLIDIFTGVTCYSLQSHLRTSVPGLGQVETDEIYVGVDKRGAHYVFPVQAKSRKDKIGIIQIEQDIALCAAKFPNLICCPIAAQLVTDNLIAIFMFENTPSGARLVAEKQYRLVPPDALTTEDLAMYRQRLEE